MDNYYQPGLYSSQPSSENADLGAPNEILRVAHRLVSSLEQSGRAILLTSMGPGEGKTMITQHLALACGTLLDQRVMICDIHGQHADARSQSGIDHLAQPEPRVGMPEHMYAMSGEFSQELQASYSIEPTQQPLIKRLELNMNRGNLYRFLKDQLPLYRQEYRLFFVEAPGIYAHQKPDTVVLSPLFDQVILIIQPQKTPAEKIQDALSLLRNNGVKDIKLLLNRGPHSSQNEAITTQLLRSPWVNALLDIPWVRKFGQWLQSRPRKTTAKDTPPYQDTSFDNPTGYPRQDIQVQPRIYRNYHADHSDHDPRNRS